MKYFVLACASILATCTVAQTDPAYSKGQFYFNWGWNQAQYTDSDIQFRGNGYNFTLEDVVATDRPTHFKPDIYFNPETVTIPQTNIRFGYFITDNWSVSLGYDHMKYVVRQYQTVQIEGSINTGSSFDGTYDDDYIDLTTSFLKYEHTDGLNYVFVGADYWQRLWAARNSNVNVWNIQVYGTLGFDAGVYIPKSNVILMGNEQSDRFHLAGFGVSGNAAINVNFWKYFYVAFQLKSGYINLPDVKTTLDDSDYASQEIVFLQENFVLGFSTHF